MSNLPNLNFDVRQELRNLTGQEEDYEMEREEAEQWINEGREARAIGQEEEEEEELLRGQDDFEPLRQVFRRNNNGEWSVSNSTYQPPDSTTDDFVSFEDPSSPEEANEEDEVFEEAEDELNTPHVSPIPPPSPQPGPSNRVTPPPSPIPGPSNRTTPPPSPTPGPSHRVTPPNSPPRNHSTPPPQEVPEEEQPPTRRVKLSHPKPQAQIKDLKKPRKQKKQTCTRTRSRSPTRATPPASPLGPWGNLAAAVFPAATRSSSERRYHTRSSGQVSGQEWIPRRPLERKPRET